MPTPTILLGRMRMREDLTVAETGSLDGDRSLALSGQESIPRLSAARVVRQREDFLTLAGNFVTVSFQVKSYLNGFYFIDNVSGTVEDWDDDLLVFRWACNLARIGTESDIDIESRLSGSQSRQNNFGVTGVRSHSPAIGHSSYWTDATVTSAVLRNSEEGEVRLYQGLGLDMSPRWTVTPENYGGGRTRFLDNLEVERAGESARLGADSWELSNGLVRVRPLTINGVLEVSAYTDGIWHPKSWDILFDGNSVGSFDFCSILNNQYEMTSVRLLKSMTVGRLYVDLILRRGFRFLEIYVQSEYGGTIKVQRGVVEAGTNALPGTIVAASNDGDDNQYIIGSSRTFVPDIVSGGLSIAATAVLDAFIGVLADGTSAIAGDQAMDLRAQYIGAPNELVQGVRR